MENKKKCSTKIKETIITKDLKEKIKKFIDSGSKEDLILLEEGHLTYDLSNDNVKEEVDKLCSHKIDLLTLLILLRYAQDKISGDCFFGLEDEKNHKFSLDMVISLLEKYKKFHKVFITKKGSLYFCLEDGTSLRIKARGIFKTERIMQKIFFVDKDTIEKIKYSFASRLGSDFLDKPIKKAECKKGSYPIEIGYYYPMGGVGNFTVSTFRETSESIILLKQIPNHMGNVITQVIDTEEETRTIKNLILSDKYFESFAENNKEAEEKRKYILPAF